MLLEIDAQGCEGLSVLTKLRARGIRSCVGSELWI